MAALDTLLAWVAAQPRTAGFSFLEVVRNRCAVAHAELLRSSVGLSDDDRLARSALRDSKASARQKRRDIDRARAMANNPALGGLLASGEITPEHVDALAAADKQTDGAASASTELVDQLVGTDVNRARRAVRDWVDDHQDPDDTQTRHDRAHERRCVIKAPGRDGMARLTLEGPKADIDRLEARIQAAADASYRADGGRDVPAREHQHSWSNRRYDAAVALLSSDPNAHRSAGSGRAQIVLTAHAAEVDLGTPRAVQLGTGPVADSVLAQEWCNAELMGVVFGAQGEVLWKGRSTRLATDAQWVALAARDRGCVRCGSPPGQCVAHHLIPFNAPKRGRTDIDQMALVCHTCHTDIHQNQLTLERRDGHWRTRPATADEMAPTRSSVAAVSRRA